MSAIEKTLTVPLAPMMAFARFADLPGWWPVETHSLSSAHGQRPMELLVEDMPGGRIYEVLPDGSEADWAQVALWEPGRRIDLVWLVGAAPGDETRLSLRFERVAEGCRVTLLHEGWQTGPAGQARRDSYLTGWDEVFIGRYGRACGAR